MSSPSASSSASFVLELGLKVNSHEETELLKRFEAARHVYNACLGEAKRRLGLAQQSKQYQGAKALPRESEERKEAFRGLHFQFGFREYDLHQYAAAFNHSWIGEHLDINTIQKLATRAFNAILKVAFGQAKHVRFKSKNQMDSVEGKSNKSGIRYRSGFVCWQGLKLACIIDPADPVVAHGLRHLIKYCRLVKRRFGVNGKVRFFVQLILEGIPYQKQQFPEGEVGLDIGPSTIGYVSENQAQLETFCQELKSKQQEIRRLQRKLERSRRATNPQNYNADADADGTVKNRQLKGKLKWHFSNGYRNNKTKLAEVLRQQKAHRKTLHGNLVNRILKNGKRIKTEKLSYKAFQKRFGKSVQFRAPGLFMSLLRRKAESAGGQVYEFSTRETKLSQYCHLCGKYTKKPLNQRWQTCCGMQVQRDLYSAYLALHVQVQVQGNSLDTTAVCKQWSSMESMLVQAVSLKPQAASGKHPLSSFGTNQRQSGSPAKSF